ncbi:MAG: hypothetical protein E6G97_22760 [Alphaproteobacteria bacterium]|nr:MAG: hypothetical protein E6G97_22760 [Alphaproteobacteria bacterium]
MFDGKNLLKTEYVAPGAVKLSAAALQYARDFIRTVAAVHGDNYVAAFDWAQSVTIRRSPDTTPEPIEDCLMLGASERSDVPPESIHRVDGVEFVIELPSEILRASTQRVIDFDTSVMFKLVLR